MKYFRPREHGELKICVCSSRKIGDREVRQTNVSEPINPGGQGPSTTTSLQTMNERVVLPSEIMNLPNMVFLLKFPEFHVTPIGLDIVSLMRTRSF
jgi:hypothetical protein